MNEQARSPRERVSPGGDPDHGFDTDDDAINMLVTIASGPYAEQLPVGNLRVSEIRARFRDRFDLDPRSRPVLDGHEANENTLVRAGQVLMFTHRAGEKGRAKKGSSYVRAHSY